MKAEDLVWVPWLLIILGWGITNAQAMERERRKEMRSLLDTLIGVADEIETLATEYHSSISTPDERSELAILRGFTRISHIQNASAERGLFGPRPKYVFPWGRKEGKEQKKRRLQLARDNLIAYRRSVTLENFRSGSFVSKKVDEIFIVKIGSARDALVNHLEETFTRRYY